MGLLLSLQIQTDDWDNDPVLSKVRKDRGYTYEDMITCSREKLPNYDEKVNIEAERFYRLSAFLKPLK